LLRGSAVPGRPPGAKVHSSWVLLVRLESLTYVTSAAVLPPLDCGVLTPLWFSFFLAQQQVDVKTKAAAKRRSPKYLRMRLLLQKMSCAPGGVPLTPLRAKSGTGVVGAVQVVDGHWVMIGDPCATFFRDLAKGGGLPRGGVGQSLLREALFVGGSGKYVYDWNRNPRRHVMADSGAWRFRRCRRADRR
jgi:hypothetical protein